MDETHYANSCYLGLLFVSLLHSSYSLLMFAGLLMKQLFVKTPQLIAYVKMSAILFSDYCFDYRVLLETAVALSL